MATTIDKTIQELFAKLEVRKAKIAELKAQISKAWKTTGSFKLLGASTPTNIQTASQATIEECAAHLCIYESGFQAALERLNIASGRSLTIQQGYSADAWISDFQKRLATINVREEEAQLAHLEARLNSVLSPEERRRIEVELLAKEL